VESVANELLSALEIVDRLREIDEATAARPRAPGKWSRKQILGHLVDSAANNHQGFVRLQLSPRIDLPGYDGDDWVRLQRYQDRPWREIIELWRAYNVQLASLIRDVNAAALQNVWRKPDGQELNLEFIMRDYVVHLRHHLEQIAT
jgi:DinB superfamily